MSKWIRFTEIEQKAKTKVWQVESTLQGTVIGTVRWYPAWRKYAFEPEETTVFEEICLCDIVEFCEQATRNHKAARHPRTP